MKAISRTTPVQYGGSLRVSVGVGEDPESAHLSSYSGGVSASVCLTRDQLVAHRDAINALLAEQDA